MSLPASVSRQTVIPFTPAAANLDAEVSIDHGLVVIVWMHRRERPGSGAICGIDGVAIKLRELEGKNRETALILG